MYSMFIELRPDTLSPGDTYILQAELAGAVAGQELEVSQPPHSGSCTILPLSGE